MSDMVETTRKDTFKTGLAKNLKAARKSRFKRQEDLSKITGINITSLSAYENASKVPSLQTALILAKALDTTVEDLTCDPEIVSNADGVAADDCPEENAANVCKLDRPKKALYSNCRPVVMFCGKYYH